MRRVILSITDGEGERLGASRIVGAGSRADGDTALSGLHPATSPFQGRKACHATGSASNGTGNFVAQKAQST